MKLFAFLIFLLPTLVFSQWEEEGPILGNPSLWNGESQALRAKANSFDSTFVFITDTLTLPVFDDFSRNKFQQYKATYSDPGVTSQKFYVLYNNAGTIALPADTKFSLDSTFHRYVDTTNNVISDTALVAQVVKVGSLESYPVDYVSTTVFPAYMLIDTLDFPNPTDTLYLVDNIVVQDSATQFFKQLNNPDKYWLDNSAYHNYRFAVNPWTLGVATFDGLDAQGYPYSFGSPNADFADALTSKPINLSGLGIQDSVYLSFLYQPQGFGEEPDDQDSLILEFYNPLLDSWEHIWSTGGGPVQDFKVGHIGLQKADYYANNFQMRFRNYSSLAGGIDHFHLDYVHLRKFSSKIDTLFKDFAFVYPIGSLLKDYTSVPWDHYKNSSDNKMNNNGEIVVRNGSNQPENNQNGSVEIKQNGVTEGSYVLNGQVLSGGTGNINYGPRTTYYSYHDFSSSYQFDRTKTGTKQIFNVVSAASALFTNPVVNDSSFRDQYFGNYYSYDDGTAEKAYGVTGVQARLAIKYIPYEADSLIGAAIHFVPSVQDVSNKLFVITVWADNGGVPGQVLYEDNLFFPRQPLYETSPNKFVNYFFLDTVKVPVSGTFYIGWRQFDAERLNVGIDKNLDNKSKTLFSTNGGNTWNTSSITGSVMIRPIFSTDMDAELGIQQKQIEESVKVIAFPNPTANSVTLSSNSTREIEEYEVFSLEGRRVAGGSGKVVDLSYFEKGIYLIRTNVSSQAIRVIKSE